LANFVKNSSTNCFGSSCPYSFAASYEKIAVDENHIAIAMLIECCVDTELVHGIVAVHCPFIE
jgi:hypothetical protein